MSSADMPRPKFWVHFTDGNGEEHTESYDHYVGDPLFGIVGAWERERQLLDLWVVRDRRLSSPPIVTAQRIRPSLGEGVPTKKAAGQATFGMEGTDAYVSSADDD